MSATSVFFFSRAISARKDISEATVWIVSGVSNYCSPEETLMLTLCLVLLK